MIRCSAALLALTSGCSDQVGYFDDTLSLAESSTGSEPLSTSFMPVTDSGSWGALDVGCGFPAGVFDLL